MVLLYRCWTTCRHCGLPYALRHAEPEHGHWCSVGSSCLVILPFVRCPTCAASVHAACPEDVPSTCPDDRARPGGEASAADV